MHYKCRGMIELLLIFFIKIASTWNFVSDPIPSISEIFWLDLELLKSRLEFWNDVSSNNDLFEKECVVKLCKESSKSEPTKSKLTDAKFSCIESILPPDSADPLISSLHKVDEKSKLSNCWFSTDSVTNDL